MRHRGIKERPNPQFWYDNAVCTSLSHVECTDGPAGRALLPAPPLRPQPRRVGSAELRAAPRRCQAEKSLCPDGNGQDPSEMENGAESPDPYEGRDSVVKF